MGKEETKPGPELAWFPIANHDGDGNTKDFPAVVVDRRGAEVTYAVFGPTGLVYKTVKEE